MTELNTDSVCDEIVPGRKNALCNRVYTALKEITLEKKIGKHFSKEEKCQIGD